MIELFEISGYPPHTNYLFLGDYVDRGSHSLEVFLLILLYKIKYPQNVTLIRGNHETKALTQSYGFFMECQNKYGDTLAWEIITELFNFLPLSAVIDGKFFCVHGGLSPMIEEVDQIQELDRFHEIPHEGPIADLMWSDPDMGDNPGFTYSSRGAGYLFGEGVLKKFLERNGVECVIRAHQICMDGYTIHFGGGLHTVWSAPNYLHRFGNLASFLDIRESGSKEYTVFKASPENLKSKPAMYTGELGAFPSKVDKFFI